VTGFGAVPDSSCYGVGEARAHLAKPSIEFQRSFPSWVAQGFLLFGLDRCLPQTPVASTPTDAPSRDGQENRREKCGATRRRHGDRRRTVLRVVGVHD
jgi:hypothetical protein